ncbi:MAG: DUF899 family protein [Chitinophagales bacterium]|nr:DUF899 family protein [Chitinophagales bacterium]
MSEISAQTNHIKDLYAEINERRQKIVDLRKEMPAEEIKDYTLKDFEGNGVKLSSLFRDTDELLVIHNMGKGCVYCTMWADGFNGLWEHIDDHVPFVLVSPDPPQVQKEFASSRNWQFPILSGHDSSFIEDLGFKTEKGYYPGVSALIRKDGKIYRKTYDYFGPGDYYNAAWHLFDLLPGNTDQWVPKYSYRK